MPLKAIYSYNIPLVKLSDSLPDHGVLLGFFPLKSKYFSVTFKSLKAPGTTW